MVLFTAGQPEYGRFVTIGPQAVVFDVAAAAVVVAAPFALVLVALPLAEEVLPVPGPDAAPAAHCGLLARQEVLALLTAMEPPTPPAMAAARTTTMRARRR